jgi:hypothetical protein
MPSKKFVIPRNMEKVDLDVLISKILAGTIYETAGDLKVFTKIWNDAQDKLQAKWEAEAHAEEREYENYKIDIKSCK